MLKPTFHFQVEERQLNAIVQRKIDENRAEYKQLMIEAVLPPPQNVCIAAVHVENAITWVKDVSTNFLLSLSYSTPVVLILIVIIYF